MKRRRRLRPDEAELWARVVESASPLHPAAPPAPPAPLSAALPAVPQVPPPTRVMLPPLIRPPGAVGGSVSLDLRPSVSDRLAAQRVGMDRKKFGRMKRGKLSPEARLDLHGMTQAQAHADLTGFILLSHRMGRRLVLIITGKGGGTSQGVLRQHVPHWLSLPPLRPFVLQIAEAHLSHGGAGAIYVYLRRSQAP